MTVVSVHSDRADEYARLLERHGVEVATSAPVLLADPRLVGSTALDGVQWIQSTWAGVDAVDWSVVPDDVVVTALPGVFGAQIVEFVFGYLLGRTQRVPERHATRRWDETPPEALRGSLLGILGAGSIGAAVAEAGGVFGMRVRGCRRSGEPDPGYHEMYAIDDLRSFADGVEHLVAILPATPETVRIVDADVLERLAPGATFVNVGRGVTADTDAVVSVVRTGRVGLAVLDVTDPEPLPDDHPAWDEAGVVVTGHTAAVSHPSDVVTFFFDNLARFEAGEALLGIVDRKRGY